MHPDLITLGPFTLHAYGAMMAVGFVVGLANWLWLGRRQDYSFSFCTDLMLWVMVSGVVGARLAYVFENWSDYAGHLGAIVRIDQGGLVFYGGFVAASIAVVVFARYRRKPLLPLLDFVVTSVPLAHAMGRIGCFLNGCCFGAVAEHASCCAVRYPRGSIPWFSHWHDGLIAQYSPLSLAVHPVQLYEAGVNMLVYGLLVYMYRRHQRTGVVTASYLVFYGLIRFILEFLRGDHAERVSVWHLSIGQFVSIFVVLAGLLMLALVATKFQKGDPGHV